MNEALQGIETTPDKVLSLKEALQVWDYGNFDPGENTRGILQQPPIQELVA